jgi:hypothetical protein
MAFILIVLLALGTMGSAADFNSGDMTSYYKRTGAKFLEEKSQVKGVKKLKNGILVEVEERFYDYFDELIQFPCLMN